MEAALKDSNSLLYTYKRLIDLRKTEPVIVDGDYTKVETGNANVLAYLRELAGEKLLVMVNFSPSDQRYQLDFVPSVKKWLITNYSEELSSSLAPYEAFAIKIK